ncbi:MAG: mechanosensitive ion channel family protein [Treponema sp.]
MNEEVIAESQTIVSENVTVIESVTDVGAAAAKTISETKENFTNWLKSYCSWENLFKIIGAAIIIFLIYVVYKIAARAIKKIPEEKLSAQKVNGILKLLQYVFYFLVAMYVLGLFGVKLSAIWGAAGVAGVAFAFAAQTSVSNIISGLFIYIEKTMKVGDLITVGSETGIVDTIGFLSVQVHTLDNQLIRIPNSTIINSNVRNTSYFAQRRMTVSVSVSYETDMQLAFDTLMKVPALCPHVIAEPAPAVWFDGFGSNGISLTIAVWFNSCDFIATKNEVFIAIKKVFDEAKIEIPYTKLDVKFGGADLSDENILKTGAGAKTKRKAALLSSAKKGERK